MYSLRLSPSFPKGVPAAFCSSPSSWSSSSILHSFRHSFPYLPTSTSTPTSTSSPSLFSPLPSNSPSHSFSSLSYRSSLLRPLSFPSISPFPFFHPSRSFTSKKKPKTHAQSKDRIHLSHTLSSLWNPLGYKISLFGVPNTGKSTIFNRLVGESLAIVHNVPGVTRDRREGKGRISHLEFHIVDTAGLEETTPTFLPMATAKNPKKLLSKMQLESSLQENIRLLPSKNKDISPAKMINGQPLPPSLQDAILHQTKMALKESDIAIFVLDGRKEIGEEEKHFLKWMKKHSFKDVTVKVEEEEGSSGEFVSSPRPLSTRDGYVTYRVKIPILILVNKIDEEFDMYSEHISPEYLTKYPSLFQAESLGFGPPIPFSAEFQNGFSLLYDSLSPLMDKLKAIKSKIKEQRDREFAMKIEEQMGKVQGQLFLKAAENTKKMLENATAKKGVPLLEIFKLSQRTNSQEMALVPMTSALESPSSSSSSLSPSSSSSPSTSSPSSAPIPIIEPFQLSIVGKPNVGKSSLTNLILGTSRVITGPEPGITRDDIHIPIDNLWISHHDILDETTGESVNTPVGYRVTLVDTAGLRGISPMYKQKYSIVDSMAMSRSLRCINLSQVVALVVDISEGIELDQSPDLDGDENPKNKNNKFSPKKEIDDDDYKLRSRQRVEKVFSVSDLQIAKKVVDEGRGLLVILNKWDKIPSKHHSSVLVGVKELLSSTLHNVPNVEVLPMSSIASTSLPLLQSTILKVYQRWDKRISTAKLNSWLRAITTFKPHPSVNGKPIKMKFITQVKSRPPTFSVWCSRAHQVSDGYVRFLSSAIREEFGLQGTVIKMRIKSGVNPFDRREGGPDLWESKVAKRKEAERVVSRKASTKVKARRERREKEAMQQGYEEQRMERLAKDMGIVSENDQYIEFKENEFVSKRKGNGEEEEMEVEEEEEDEYQMEDDGEEEVQDEEEEEEEEKTFISSKNHKSQYGMKSTPSSSSSSVHSSSKGKSPIPSTTSSSSSSQEIEEEEEGEDASVYIEEENSNSFHSSTSPSNLRHPTPSFIKSENPEVDEKQKEIVKKVEKLISKEEKWRSYKEVNEDEEEGEGDGEENITDIAVAPTPPRRERIKGSPVSTNENEALEEEKGEDSTSYDNDDNDSLSGNSKVSVSSSHLRGVSMKFVSSESEPTDLEKQNAKENDEEIEKEERQKYDNEEEENDKNIQEEKEKEKNNPKANEWISKKKRKEIKRMMNLLEKREEFDDHKEESQSEMEEEEGEGEGEGEEGLGNDKIPPLIMKEKDKKPQKESKIPKKIKPKNPIVIKMEVIKPNIPHTKMKKAIIIEPEEEVVELMEEGSADSTTSPSLSLSSSDSLPYRRIPNGESTGHRRNRRRFLSSSSPSTSSLSSSSSSSSSFQNTKSSNRPWELSRALQQRRQNSGSSRGQGNDYQVNREAMRKSDRERKRQAKLLKRRQKEASGRVKKREQKKREKEEVKEEWRRHRQQHGQHV